MFVKSRKRLPCSLFIAISFPKISLDTGKVDLKDYDQISSYIKRFCQE